MKRFHWTVEAVTESPAADVELANDGHRQPEVAIVLDHEVVLEEVGTRLHGTQEVQHVAAHADRHQEARERAQNHAGGHVDEKEDEGRHVGGNVDRVWLSAQCQQPQ